MSFFEIMVFVDNYRINKKLDQKYISNKMGVSRTTLSNWSYGRKKPTLNHFIELLDILGLEMVIKEKEAENGL